MTNRPVSLLDLVTEARWFRSNLLRRSIFAALIVIFAILSLFPRIYAAEITLAPQESNTAGLSAILQQLGGNYAALLGHTQPVEVDLAIARSYDVRKDVLRRLGVRDDESTAEFRRALKKLEAQSEVQAMRGNLMHIEIRDRDPSRALFIARAYSQAMRERLAELSREATTNKRTILDQRFSEARDRLARAEAAVSEFRRANQIITPDTQLNLAVEQLANAQGQLKAKQVELEAALRFNTSENFEVQRIRAELTALQQQVNAAEQRVQAGGGLTAAGIAPIALRYQNLMRELKFSEALYDSYTRYLEGAAIEDLTAQYNLQEIEPPFVDPDTHFNEVPLALLIVLVLLALAAEFIVIGPPPRMLTQSSAA